jgi:hypothetical protein
MTDAAPVDRHWLPVLEENARRMDVLEQRIDALVAKILPSPAEEFDDRDQALGGRG